MRGFTKMFGPESDAQAVLLAESLRLRKLSKEIRERRQGARDDLRMVGKLAVVATASAAFGLHPFFAATAAGLAAVGVAAVAYNAITSQILEKEAAPLKEKLFPSRRPQTVINNNLPKPRA